VGRTAVARRSRIPRLRAVAIAIALAISSPVFGGAWVQNKGEGLVISGLLLSGADHSLDNSGNRQPGLYFSKYESSFYAEYGISDRLTLILQLAGQQVSQDNNGITDTASGLSASRLGLQRRLVSMGRWTSSLQVSAVIPGGGENVADRPLGDGANGIEFRWLTGRSIAENGFLDFQLARTWRADNYPAEFRADVTLGWRPTERYVLMAQSFFTQGEADRQRNNRAFSQYKLQVSAGRRVGNGTLMAGVFTTVYGRNSIEESGVTLSWWRRF
jgi:hypothetical protein